MKRTIMLKKNYQFKDVLSKGKFFSGKQIIVYIKKNNKNINRIGLAISVKIAKAVKRNKIKRIIKENYKEIEKNLKNGYDIVFLWKKKINPKEVNFYKVKNDFINIFDKANIIKKIRFL